MKRRTAAAGLALLALTACSAGGQPNAAPPAPSDVAAPEASPSAQAVSSTDRPPRRVRIATFNVLGNSHTEGGERGPGWASGPRRMDGVVELLDQYSVTLVGFQEFEPIQARTFESLREGSWELAHNPGDTGNSLAWDTDVWRALKVHALPIPYFNGTIRRIPVVLLKRVDRVARMWVINAHNPANTGRFPRQEKWRYEALRRELATVDRLTGRHDQPVLLLGDFNDREIAFCRVSRAGLHASAGGSATESTCDPPVPTPIDWIFGTDDITFGRHVRDLAPMRAKISDHPIHVTSMRIDRSE
jgi:endonuclease/exonuclease/phosphatase family metal-dependent hydrolase